MYKFEPEEYSSIMLLVKMSLENNKNVVGARVTARHSRL